MISGRYTYDFAVPVLHQRSLFRAKFNVEASGLVTMTDDDPLVDLPDLRLNPIDLPEI